MQKQKTAVTNDQPRNPDGTFKRVETGAEDRKERARRLAQKTAEARAAAIQKARKKLAEKQVSLSCCGN